jgi:hypothetical protein
MRAQSLPITPKLMAPSSPTLSGWPGKRAAPFEMLLCRTSTAVALRD